MTGGSAIRIDYKPNGVSGYTCQLIGDAEMLLVTVTRSDRATKVKVKASVQRGCPMAGGRGRRGPVRKPRVRETSNEK